MLLYPLSLRNRVGSRVSRLIGQGQLIDVRPVPASLITMRAPWSHSTPDALSVPRNASTLVTGRLFIATEHLDQGRLIDDRHAELASPVSLAPGVLSHDDEVGLA